MLPDGIWMISKLLSRFKKRAIEKTTDLLHFPGKSTVRAPKFRNIFLIFDNSDEAKAPALISCYIQNNFSHGCNEVLKPITK